MNELATTNSNVPAYEPQPTSNLVSVQEQRAIQEVQGKMAIAKRFPRDPFRAHKMIMKECESLGIAGGAVYAYPRGRERVEGPSIRLAEVIARHWGNMECGIEEVSQTPGVSQMRAWAIDFETNFSDVKTFTVKHERKARGKISKMEDPRDVYEHTANLATRRKRACMLSIIPSWIIDEAVIRCKETVKKGISENLDERVRKLVVAFGKMGITEKQIETRLGYKFENINADDFVDLRNVYASIKDGIGKREEFFDFKIKDETDQAVLAAGKKTEKKSSEKGETKK